jgi:hypothetical protein
MADAGDGADCRVCHGKEDELMVEQFGVTLPELRSVSGDLRERALR